MDKTSGQNIRKLIPENLGKDSYFFSDFPFIGRIKVEDGIVTFGPPLLIFFISAQVLPQQLQIVGVGASAVVLLIALSVLVIKPNYMSLSGWVSTVRKFREREKEQRKNIRTDGGRQITTLSATDDEDTRRTTGIKKIHPNYSAVERIDGTMVGMIEFSGANLDVVEPEEYERYVNQLASSVNTQLRDDVQFYLPKRQVDVSDHIEEYTERLDDEKISTDRLLSHYVQDRVGWLEAVSEESYTRDYFAIVTVSPMEVIEQQTMGESLQSIRSLPLGDEIADIIIGIRGGTSRDISQTQLKIEQLKELDRKVESVQQTLTVGPNNTSQRLDGTQAGLLLKEFWEGKSVDTIRNGTFVREKPFITSE